MSEPNTNNYNDVEVTITIRASKEESGMYKMGVSKCIYLPQDNQLKQKVLEMISNYDSFAQALLLMIEKGDHLKKINC